MSKGPIPRSLLRLLRLPAVNRAALAGLRRSIRKRRDLFPRDLSLGAEGFFVHDLIGNFAFDGEGRPDSFRLTVNNAWFDQRITALKLTVNGRVVRQRDTFLRAGDHLVGAGDVHRLDFEAGKPVELIARGRKLGRGMHIVEMDLALELATMYAPVPVVMSGNRGRLVMVDGDPGNLDFDVEGAGERMHFVPHVHYDVEWLQTSEVFEKLGARNILEALHLLDRDPDYTFVLDQIPQLAAMARAHPERFEELAGQVKSGRVEIVNGLFAEPDTNLISGESLVMGSVLFQRWAKETFGRTCPVGWLIDSFGQSAQLPQILAKSGTEFLAFSRELDLGEDKSEFIWEGLDGSRLLCHFMPIMYYAGYPLPEDRRRAFKRMARIYDSLKVAATGGDLLVPAGVDHGKPQSAPLRHLPAWNRSVPGVVWRFSTPSRFFKTVRRGNLAVRKGEFQRVFPGVWSARPRLKQLNRQAEALLEETEKFCTMAAIGGMDYPRETLKRAWEILLGNQFHDRICGCVTDDVARHTETRYGNLIEELKEAGHRARSYLGERLAPQEGPGVRIAVFNALSFERSDWIEATIEDAAGMEDYALMAPEGPIEFQVLDRHRYGDGSLKSLTLGFVARLPALGYRVFHFTDAPGVVRPAPGDLSVSPTTVTGPIWAVSVSESKGTVRSVKGVADDVELDLGSAGELELERDLGSLMAPLIIRRGKKREKPDRVFWTEKGPLSANLRTEGVIGRTRFVRDVRIYRDLRRIDVTLRMDYRDPGYRLRAKAGTGVKVKSWVHEVPYGAMERPAHELPAHRWVDASNGKKGLAILNRAIAGHELRGQTAYLSLLRSQDKIFFFEAGPGAFSLGDQTFRFALVPHAGDWTDARLWRKGRAFESPPRTLLAGKTSGDGPASRSFARVQPAGVVLTAMRMPDADRVEMRLVECAGKPASAVLALGFPARKAEVTDLLGRSLATLPIRKGKIEIAMKGFEIVTLRLET